MRILEQNWMTSVFSLCPYLCRFAVFSDLMSVSLPLFHSPWVVLSWWMAPDVRHDRGGQARAWKKLYCHSEGSASCNPVGHSGSGCLCSLLKRSLPLSPVTQKTTELWNLKADIDLTYNHKSHSTWNAQILSCKHADKHAPLALVTHSSMLKKHTGKPTPV